MSTTTTTTAEQGTYSDGSRVQVIGRRGGFTYVTFLDGRNRGITCKVPSSWVTEDELPEPAAAEPAPVTPAPDGHAAQSDLWGTRTAFSDPQYTVRAFTTASPLAGGHDVIKGVTVTYSRREAAQAVRRARARGLFIDVTFTYSRGGHWAQAEWDLS